MRLPDADASTAGQFRDAFVRSFPSLAVEVRSFDERSDRITAVFSQVGSGLLLVGFSALFIGGLGVFNSIKAYLDGKLTSLATLRAIGLRYGRLAAYVLLQVLLLAALSSAVGALFGVLLAVGGASLAADRLPIALLLLGLWQPAAVAWLFGVLTACTFALPAMGRALSVSPAALFRGLEGQDLRSSRQVKKLTAVVAMVTVALLVVALPDPRFGLAFVVAVTVLLLLLDLTTRLLKRLAERLQGLACLLFAVAIGVGWFATIALTHASRLDLAWVGLDVTACGQRDRACTSACDGVLRYSTRSDRGAQRCDETVDWFD